MLISQVFCFSPPLQRAVTKGGEGWPAIPPPHIPFAPDFSYLLDVLAPVPLPFLFIVLSLFVLCFFWFFADLLIFSAPVSPLSFHYWAFFRASTATSFQRAPQCLGICLCPIGFFLVFPFACICFFVFSLYFCLFFFL